MVDSHDITPSRLNLMIELRRILDRSWMMTPH